MTAPRRPRQVLEVAALVLALALTAGAWADGVRVVPVLTGSMAPAVPAGSLVVTTPLDPDRVHEGEVVAFAPPPPHGLGRPVMHRVVEVTSVGGIPVMRTGGDANPGPDPWTVGLPGADLARARLVLPHLGRVVSGGPTAAMLLAAGGLLLVSGASLVAAARRERCRCPVALDPSVSGSPPPTR